MKRRACWYLVGLAVLATLTGCGRGLFQVAEREPWRREAEIACLKSGEVKEGFGLVRIEPIEGPGVCGADFPLKVASLGGSTALGFADDLRPPRAVPGEIAQMGAPPSTLKAQRDALRWSDAPARAPASGPMSLYAPGVDAPPPDLETAPDILAEPEPDRADGAYDAPPPLARQPLSRPVSKPLPTLGPPRGQRIAAIGPVAFKPAATLACPIVSAVDKWISEAIQPAAMRWFGSPVAEIKQISAYSCRGMNGNPRARISEHAFGNALDIAAFVLADGRKITIRSAWKGLPEEQGFLRDVQAGACERFTTVLAPGSNAFHADHFHVDLMRRSSGRSICKPRAQSGEEIAARAGGGRFAGRSAGYTGSIGNRAKAAPGGPQVIEDIDDPIDEDGDDHH